MKRTKRILNLLLALIMVTFSIVSAFSVTSRAEETMPRLNDYAGLLSSSEANEVLEVLNDVSKKHSFDIVICTVSELPDGYTNIIDFADDYFDYTDFGYGTMDRNGCILVLDMSSRDWRIETTGYGKTVFTDWGIDYIGDQMKKSGLSDGEYADAFKEFAKQCDKFIKQADKGKPYDKNNQPKLDKSVALKKALKTGIIAGVIIAFIIMLFMVASMKSVAKKTEAGHYVVENSLNVTYANDVFLYSKVSRTRKESSSSGGSSTHTGSSGVSHGGGGGKF